MTKRNSKFDIVNVCPNDLSVFINQEKVVDFVRKMNEDFFLYCEETLLFKYFIPETESKIEIGIVVHIKENDDRINLMTAWVFGFLMGLDKSFGVVI